MVLLFHLNIQSNTQSYSLFQLILKELYYQHQHPKLYNPRSNSCLYNDYLKAILGKTLNLRKNLNISTNNIILPRKISEQCNW